MGLLQTLVKYLVAVEKIGREYNLRRGGVTRYRVPVGDSSDFLFIHATEAYPRMTFYLVP